MDNPGAFDLGDLAIAGPSTQVGDVVDGLDGMASLALQARLASGGGGTSCRVYVQTSLDQGQTWFDLAAFVFAAAGGVQVAALAAGSVAPFSASNAALLDGTIQAGAPLGDRLRVKVVTTGTYVGSTLLSVWACVR